jgi:hypothetical protein
MILHRLSQEAFCMDTLDVEKLKRHPTQIKRIRAGDETLERKCVLVGAGDRQYWADKITGTLYRMDGSCPSSERLRMLNPK